MPRPKRLFWQNNVKFWGYERDEEFNPIVMDIIQRL